MTFENRVRHLADKVARLLGETPKKDFNHCYNIATQGLTLSNEYRQWVAIELAQRSKTKRSKDALRQRFKL